MFERTCASCGYSVQLAHDTIDEKIAAARFARHVESHIGGSHVTAQHVRHAR